MNQTYNSNNNSHNSNNNNYNNNNSQKNTNFFTFLPIDIFRFILKYLNMKDIGNLDTSFLNYNLRNYFLESLKGIEITNLNENSHNTEELNWIIIRGIIVKDITIETYDFDDNEENILKVIENNKLTLHSLHLNESRINDDIFLYLKQCPFLTTLDLEYCKDITDQGLNMFLNSNQKLQFLNLADCDQLTFKTINKISQSCSQLRHLNLTSLPVTDNHVKKIIKGCPLIETFVLSSTEITDESVVNILEAYPDIQSLFIDECSNISTDMIVYVLRVVGLRHIYSNNFEEQILGLESFRLALLDANDLVDEMISMGVLPRLVELLEPTKHPRVLLGVCVLLAFKPQHRLNEYRTVLIEGNVIPRLITLLYLNNREVVLQAILALIVIGGKKIEYRDHVWSDGTLPILLSLCQTQLGQPFNKLSDIFYEELFKYLPTLLNLLLNNPTSFLSISNSNDNNNNNNNNSSNNSNSSNNNRSDNISTTTINSMNLIATTTTIMINNDYNNYNTSVNLMSSTGYTLQYNCYTVLKILTRDSSFLNYLLETNFISQVVNKLLYIQHIDIVTEILEIIGNIFNGDEVHAHILIEMNILQLLSEIILQHPSNTGELVWVIISNIINKTSNLYFDMILSLHMIPNLLAIKYDMNSIEYLSSFIKLSNSIQLYQLIEDNLILILKEILVKCHLEIHLIKKILIIYQTILKECENENICQLMKSQISDEITKLMMESSDPIVCRLAGDIWSSL